VLRLALTFEDVHADRSSQPHDLERVRTLEKVEELRLADGTEAAVPPLGVDPHELLGGGVRQAPQQHPVDDAEHRRVDPDPQCHREQRDAGESRALGQHPHAESQVLPQLLEEHRPPRSLLRSAVEGAAVLLGARQVAELAERFGACRLGGHPLMDQLLGAELEVEAELGIDVPLDLRGGAPRETEDTAEPR